MAGDKLRDYVDEDAPESTTFENDENQLKLEETVEEGRPAFALPHWLTAETGPGEVEEYLTHPLNFNRSEGIARTLRGLTGMFGSLRYAVIDVVMGVLQFIRERRARAIEVTPIDQASTDTRH